MSLNGHILYLQGEGHAGATHAVVNDRTASKMRDFHIPEGIFENK